MVGRCIQLAGSRDEREGERGAGSRNQIRHLVAPDVGALAERGCATMPPVLFYQRVKGKDRGPLFRDGIMPFK